MSSSAGFLLQEWREGSLHKVSIHVPLFLSNRLEITKLVTSNGGILQSNLSAADVVLVDYCHEDTEGARYSGIKKKLGRTAHVVDKKWLMDSISMRVMQDWNKYQPQYIDDIPRQGNSDATPKQPINAKSTTQRSIRNSFTKTDEDLIEQFMAVSPGMKTSQIATGLSRLCTSHSQASILTHLQKNIGCGKQYDVKAKRFQREQGPEKLEEIRLEIMEGIPDFEWLVQARIKSSDQTRANEETSKRTRSSASNPSLLSREEARPSSDDAEVAMDRARQGIIKTENERWEHATCRDAWTETDSSLNSALLTESEKEEASANESSHQAIQIVSAPTSRRKFTREHVDRLVEKLAIWFKSIFEATPSSQDSVVGVLKSSQEFLRPPFTFFIKIAQEISTHTAEEWLAHFERQDNQQRYLELGKELFEKMLAKGAEQARQATDSEAESVLNRQRGATSSEEIEIEMSTQEDRIAETVIEEQIQANHAVADVDSDDEIDELESSDEEINTKGDEERFQDQITSPVRTHSSASSDSYDSDEPFAGLVNRKASQPEKPRSGEEDGRTAETRSTVQLESSTSVQKSTSVAQRRKVIFSIDLDDSIKSPFNVVGDIRKKSVQKVESRKRQRIMPSESNPSSQVQENAIERRVSTAKSIEQSRTSIGSAKDAQSSRTLPTNDELSDEEGHSEATVARLQALADRHSKPLLCLQYLYEIVGNDFEETEYLAVLSP